MDDLDLLKKDWKKHDNFNQVSEQDIYGMLHKNSSSIVKWLLIISILEFVLWTILNLCLDSTKHFKDQHSLFYIEIFEYLSYGVILVFIFFLYKNYKKISATVTTKQLMIDILKTKKIINYYVFYNLIMAFIVFFIGIGCVFFFEEKNQELVSKFVNNPQLLFGFIVILVVVILIILIVLWLFYKLLYGLLLKKLYANYEELKKIDL
jgi:hypothetical protein